MGHIKAKLVPAYEPESSVTMRITPKEIGTLIAAVPDAGLSYVFDQLVDESIFTTQERRAWLIQIMQGTAAKLEDHNK
jgi:hypothetical protein